METQDGLCFPYSVSELALAQTKAGKSNNSKEAKEVEATLTFDAFLRYEHTSTCTDSKPDSFPSEERKTHGTEKANTHRRKPKEEMIPLYIALFYSPICLLVPLRYGTSSTYRLSNEELLAVCVSSPSLHCRAHSLPTSS